jgi:hypothetical protein
MKKEQKAPQIRRIGLIGQMLVALILLIPLLVAGCGGHSPETTRQDSAAKTKSRYHCPMHPAVVADRPGTCPICFMDLEPITESVDAGMKGTVTVARR